MLEERCWDVWLIALVCSHTYQCTQWQMASSDVLTSFFSLLAHVLTCCSFLSCFTLSEVMLAEIGLLPPVCLNAPSVNVTRHRVRLVAAG